jgi:hypothetical protein
MKISNDLNADKIKYYTSIIIAGSLAIAPLVYWIQFNYNIKENLFFTAVFLSILFIGRVCLEIGLVIEGHFIDNKIKIDFNDIKNYYKDFRECNNVFNGNWYKYLILEDKKAAKDVISHIVDRMLFLLSSTVAIIIGVISYFILFQKLHSFLFNIAVLFSTVLFILFSIWRAKGLAAGLDFLRYIIVNGDPCENQNNQ